MAAAADLNTEYDLRITETKGGIPMGMHCSDNAGFCSITKEQGESLHVSSERQENIIRKQAGM